MDKNSFIAVLGHRGMVGSAVVRQLREQGYNSILKFEGDLTNYDQFSDFLDSYEVDYVVMAAAKVGGIMANKNSPVEFMQDNISMQSNVLKACHEHKTRKVLMLGSSCIYPKNCPIPIKEEHLLSDYLESSNEAYALAKITGLKLASYYNKQYGDTFISAMPCNLFGPGDNFSLENSHVLPALIRKFHTAKETGAEKVTLWGTGKPLREFLYVDDLAKALILLLKEYDDPGHINVGYGTDVSIGTLASFVSQIVGYEGKIEWDSSKPDGTYRKLMDSSRINNLGWTPDTLFIDALENTYKWFLENKDNIRDF